MFDTAKLIDGHVYQLGDHVDRFLYSAGKAGIQLPMSNEQMVRTILETAAASNAANGNLFRSAMSGRMLPAHVQQHCLQASISSFNLLAVRPSKISCSFLLHRLRALLAVSRPRGLWAVISRVRVACLLLHSIQRRWQQAGHQERLDGVVLTVSL